MSADRKLWVLRAWDGEAFTTLATIDPDTDPDSRHILIDEARALADLEFKTEVAVFYPEREVGPLSLGQFVYDSNKAPRPFDITSQADWKIYEEISS